MNARHPNFQLKVNSDLLTCSTTTQPYSRLLPTETVSPAYCYQVTLLLWQIKSIFFVQYGKLLARNSHMHHLLQSTWFLRSVSKPQTMSGENMKKTLVPSRRPLSPQFMVSNQNQIHPWTEREQTLVHEVKRNPGAKARSCAYCRQRVRALQALNQQSTKAKYMNWETDCGKHPSARLLM